MTSKAMRYESARERRELILEALRSSGFLAVADLTREFGVSDMTVRRDLRKLAAVGEARVVRGGVSLPHGVFGPAGFSGRANAHADAKRRIATAARELVGVGDTIAVDAGTTAYELGAALPDGWSGCVVTHSVPLLQLMLDRSPARVVGLGGDLFADSQAFVGPMTVDAATRVRVRTFFLGAAAIDERGVYVAMDVERPTKQALMDIADEVVLLVDHGKFETSAPVRLCPLARLHAVVTDRPPGAAVSERLTAEGIRLVLA